MVECVKKLEREFEFSMFVEFYNRKIDIYIIINCYKEEEEKTE